MANQFNSWEPVLDPVNGVMQQEPRILAHDAHVVVIGAVNTTYGDTGVKLTNQGAGYDGGGSGTFTGVTTTSAGGSGLILTCEVLGGKIVNVTATAAGSGYAAGDTATIDDITGTGGGSAEVEITNVDIPNTGKRGACLYVGATANVEVVLEGGGEVTFKAVQAGSFLPILVKEVKSGIAAPGDILALY